MIPPRFFTKTSKSNSLFLLKNSAKSNDQEAIPPLFEGRNSSVTMEIFLMIIPNYKFSNLKYDQNLKPILKSDKLFCRLD